MDCIFCKIDNSKFIAESDNFYAIEDGFPVSPGHSLVIAKKHTESFFDLTSNEVSEAYELLSKTKKIVDDKHNPDAYNIGINNGEAAGRTVHHLHIHLIPRYSGDVPDPRGGVRNVIPEKGNYLKQGWFRSSYVRINS